MIKYILLGFLNYQPMTGYELKQTIDDSTSHFWHAYHSQIYTILRQMEQEKLVTSQFLKEEGQPDKRVYTITEEGKQALEDWLNQTLTEASPVKEELLVRLFFSAQREPQQVLTELRLQCELHQNKLSVYHELTKHMPGHAPELKRDHVFWRMTLDMGIRYEEVYIAWLKDSIERVENL
jgi:DNA-binding PadR family transcriptional regulator